MTILQYVQIESEVVLIDSRVYCQDIIQVNHSDWISNVLMTYQILIEQAFGIFRFKNGEIDGRGRPEKYVLLTEAQTNALLVFSRNIGTVPQKKLELIADFEHAKQQLREQFERSLVAIPNPQIETLQTENQALQQQIADLTGNLKFLKGQRDNYLDQLQTLRSQQALIAEEATNNTDFPRDFDSVYAQLGYKTKSYLYFQVMIEKLSLVENQDFIFTKKRTTAQGHINYSAITMSESAYHHILGCGRSKRGIIATDTTPRDVKLSRGFITQHGTSKNLSANTFQPKEV